jgi:hypothetical protein
MRVAVQHELPNDSTHNVVRDDGTQYRITDYWGRYDEDHNDPFAIYVEYRPAPGCFIKPHFHEVPQFQVIVGGEGRLGKKPLSPITFHFSDAFSPYGPIVPDDNERGLDYFTLRPRGKLGTWYMPGARERMEGRRAGRNVAVAVPTATRLDEARVSRQALIEPHADGLAAWLVTLPPERETTIDVPAGCGGQYYLVARGRAKIGTQSLPEHSVIFAEPSDTSVSLCTEDVAGEVLVLQYPAPMSSPLER